MDAAQTTVAFPHPPCRKPLHDVCTTEERWPAVRSFHRLRTRKAGSTRFIDFHLAVDDHMSVGEAHELGDEIVDAIKEHLPDSRVYIHVEPCAYQCQESCEAGCSIPAEARHAGEAAT